MNKDNAKDYLPLVQALAEGKTIQAKDTYDGGWHDLTTPSWGMAASCYRVKPEPVVVWVNEYRSDDGNKLGCNFATEAAAIEAKGSNVNYIRTIKLVESND